MRRRFSRGRRSRSSADAGSAPIDGARAMERIVEAGVAGATALEAISEDGIADSYAAVGTGTAAGDTRIAVGFSPRSGGDALLAVAALAQRLAQDGFDGDAVAIAPQWSIASRRRLACLGALPFRLRAIVAPALAEGVVEVEVEAATPAAGGSPRQIAAQVSSGRQREIFARGLAALEGLAAKHGGAVRSSGRDVELVLMARRVAVLRADGDSVRLDAFAPQRSSDALEPATLAAALDGLEGNLRKRLNDRRVRGGEEGLRAAIIPALTSAMSLRGSVSWPLAGGDREILDLAGVTADGRIALGAACERLGLAELGAILDAAEALRPVIGGLLAGVEGPVQSGPPILALAARNFDDVALRVLPGLTFGTRLFDVQTARGAAPTLVPRGASTEAAPEAPRRRAAPAITTPTPEPVAEPDARRETEGRQSGDSEARQSQPGERGRSRRGRRGGRRGPAADTIDEVSLFDLDDDRPAAAAAESEGDEDGARRRRRGRGRRRGRRSGSASGDDASNGGRPEASASRDGDASPPRARSARRDEPRASEDEADDDLAEGLVPLVDDVSDIAEAPVAAYDDEEDREEGDSEQDRIRREREVRRRARIAKAAPEPEPEPPKARPRRAALVSHADRDSLLATILLARDVRLVEGLWVYPQEDLMTFFRSVATDLHEETPIYVVGFMATPVRDTLQAASLYRDRLGWFDHHEWPPEDLESLREAIGADAVHVTPGAGSSLPAVLTQRARRSRFSDKLVDLGMGRFTEHDFERWGRLWWHRLGEIAQRHGERRAEVDALLVGRPSDLAREAADAETPDPPPEVAFVAGKDFRLVHFGGYTMVVVPTPPSLALPLVGRVARERYQAQISLIFHDDDDLVMLAADEVSGRRILDLGSMIEHLASKHAWIEELIDIDHVARMRVGDLASRPDRLDEVIAEISMGRSILEG